MGPAFERASGATFAYAILSLTVIRMVPVSLSLLGSGLRPWSHLFLGWFGPRGIASIVFGILVLEHAADAPWSHGVLDIVVVTVTFSVVLHGLSATPAAAAYGRWVESTQRTEPVCMCENEEVPELLVRVRIGEPEVTGGGT